MGRPAGEQAGVEAVLEALPKWELLVSIMGEVQAERGRLAASGAPADAAAAAAPVVLLAREAHTCAQLAQVRTVVVPFDFPELLQ